MNTQESPSWLAFVKTRCIAKGKPQEVVAAVKKHIDVHENDNLLVFDAGTSQLVELDFRGTPASVLKRMGMNDSEKPPSATAPIVERSPGRPRLGVTGREVTLLPRHWEWLGSQPGGASVALRKLVEQAIRANQESDRQRNAQESACRFMTAMAGNNPGYEEATRALFSGDLTRLAELIAKWPRDIRSHTLSLVTAMAAKSDET